MYNDALRKYVTVYRYKNSRIADTPWSALFHIGPGQSEDISNIFVNY